MSVWPLARRRWLMAAALACADGGVRARAGASTILHFNDVYEIEPVEGGPRRRPRARGDLPGRPAARPPRPLVTTLGGDYLSPSAIGTANVDGEPLAGRQMVDVLNAVGVDWATFGDHEFDVSEDAFRQRLAEQKFRIVVEQRDRRERVRLRGHRAVGRHPGARARPRPANRAHRPDARRQSEALGEVSSADRRGQERKSRRSGPPDRSTPSSH